MVTPKLLLYCQCEACVDASHPDSASSSQQATGEALDCYRRDTTFFVQFLFLPLLHWAHVRPTRLPRHLWRCCGGSSASWRFRRRLCRRLSGGCLCTRPLDGLAYSLPHVWGLRSFHFGHASVSDEYARFLLALIPPGSADSSSRAACWDSRGLRCGGRWRALDLNCCKVASLALMSVKGRL